MIIASDVILLGDRNTQGPKLSKWKEKQFFIVKCQTWLPEEGIWGPACYFSNCILWSKAAFCLLKSPAGRSSRGKSG